MGLPFSGLTILCLPELAVGWCPLSLVLAREDEPTKLSSNLAPYMQLCIVLNDMQHVREELSHLEERLKFESFYEWLDSEDESSLGNQCRAMVEKLLGSADDDIYNRMSKIMAEITEKVNLSVNL